MYTQKVGLIFGGNPATRAATVLGSMRWRVMVAPNGTNPSTAAMAMLRKSIKIASIPSELIGATGRRYLFKELIQEGPHLGRVWLATSEHPCHSYHPTHELTTFQIRTR
jgi:hypothetical protein